MTDKARWFNQTGVCRCGRIATGILMDEFNAPIGPACKTCANKRIEAARLQGCKGLQIWHYWLRKPL